ncbi:hypothetical protein QA584_27320 [Anaerocolumna sp. AGMB13025]|uniref:hypothetical protein n=1 Tax=Anaerocolumna sp. AGMB13025 TaxID=3039116 RepID=UPI00241D90B2|nr:hypothetical protein [Anaerocolumna sp. AGMB13025]WFR57272.1 hypothetical protein QA584_27320 [Anaerocolumna sp. AGMB13025]
MTIEVAMLISGVSLAFGIYTGITNLKRNQKTDTKQDTAELTTVIVKLENIGNGISEIKSELTNVKNDSKEDRERIIRLEELTKQAHKRLDNIELYKKNE